MKNKVLAFFKNLPQKKDERFNLAFDLLRNSVGVTFQQIQKYNVLGATESNINNILYDLKKIHGITDSMIKSKKNIPEIKVVKEGYDSLSAIIGLTPNDDLENVVVSDTVDVKKTLREEFPFLSDKNCPSELHVVSGQLISSFNRYRDLHKKIQEIEAGTLEVSEEENLKIVQDCNEEFENNSSLREELIHYKNENTILGKHPVLKEYTLKKEVDSMTNEELIKFRDNSGPYFSKNKPKLTEESLPEKKKLDIKERILDREIKLGLVNAKLGINAK